MKVLPGDPYPLGAVWDGAGVNFAIFSENATKVELCLFDAANAAHESRRIPLPERTQMVWHGYFPDLRPGQVYGYRIHGPYDPAAGHRFNPNKLVLDPYAKAIARPGRWHESLCAFPPDDPGLDLVPDGRDSAPYAPLAAVMSDPFDWGEDRLPRTPLNKSVIYELHVKGFTRLHHDIPPTIRGTYAAMASPHVIRYLTNLGVTAVELMPVHQSFGGRRLATLGLTDYWGYNTLSFFAPDLRLASAQNAIGAAREFKSMVRALHAAGIEVILDVVYNHTAEGDETGPTLSFRGIDNAAYYRLTQADCRRYENFTGCGNTLNTQHYRVLQLVMDSLRYWVLEMHVDGFRFDLASALARGLGGVDRTSSFLDILTQDPVLSHVKLIAEPWDIGPGGYQVGRFPVNWAEWNGKYRDCVRRFWRGDGGVLGDLATRLSGSSDLYEQSGRSPSAGINFVTCHDGFTLHDLVSYEEKRNEANGEANRDGTDANWAWDCGVEGPTRNPAVRALRERQKRNFIATLALSQGTPMLWAGDEFGRTQNGNNNAYCQDNEISWIDWDLDRDQCALLDFTRRLLDFRRHQPALRRRKFLQGRPLPGSGVKDIAWFGPSGKEMDDEAWNELGGNCLGVRLDGDTQEMDEHGRPIVGDTLLLLMNAGEKPAEFHLPAPAAGAKWDFFLDTSNDAAPAIPAKSRRYRLAEHAMAVFVLKRGS